MTVADGVHMTKLAVSEGQPIWQTIANALSRDIRQRRTPPGAQLESEAGLAARFGVNRHTVRQAIQHLAHQGLVRIERGRGTFVQDRVVDYPIGARTRFTEILLAQGLEAGHEIVATEMAKATPDEARDLSLRAGSRVARVTTKGLAGGRIITSARNVFPASRLPGIVDLMKATRSVTAALAALDYAEYRRAWTRITAELPDAGLAATLACPRTRPVLVTEALDVAVDGTPLRLGTTAFVGDMCRLVVSA